ncbi:transposase, MuDR, MULE transposase domain protein [Tanacetum coccineum]
MSDNIPFDIQMNIINRLPVKSLLKFRAVSKQWKFSIDNFEFINENLAFRHMDSNLNIMSLTPVASSKEYEDDKNEFDDVVDDNSLPYYQKWQKYMSFKPDILETPLYTSKPMISKQFNKETHVKIGQNFDNKEALDMAIRLKALAEGYQFLNDRSAPERYALKCFHFNECAWKIRATRWGKTEKFSITSFNDVHTCPKTQTYPNHRNVNKKVIAHILTPKLQDPKRVLKGKDIQKDIMSEYKISISYQQAWRGKDYCIQQIRGSPYESFEMLPYYCYNLERKNEGTVRRIKTNKKEVFEMLFIVLGASGKPWSWWISVLKECICDNLNFLFISDKHAAIALAVQNEFPLAYHVVCCRHLMMNLSLKRDRTKALFWKICKAYTTEDFSGNMSYLQNIQRDAYDKLCQVGPQRWSRAHCPLVRYNYLESNSVESVNGCTVEYRKLPVLKLAETYRAMVQDCDHQYQVYDGRYNRQVDFHTGTCQCRKWQLSGLPCGHVIAVTKYLGLTDCLQFVSDWFKKPKYQGTYAEPIHFIRNVQEWEFPQHIQKAIPPRMDNPQPGRPKNTNRIKSQGEEPRVIHCTRCKQAGHRRDNCNKPFIFDPPINIQTQHEQQIPRYEQPSFHNPHQQYDNTFQYSSHPHGQNTYPSQPYDQYVNNTSQPYDGNHTQSAQMYDRYESQNQASQHLDDLNNHASNSWFN